MRNIDREEVIREIARLLMTTSLGVRLALENMGFENARNLSISDLENWLLSEYREPIKLTRFEKDSLKKLSEPYIGGILILRDKYGILNYRQFEGGSSSQLPRIMQNCFKFLEEEGEMYSIKWLLENCEVVDDE